MSLRFRAIWVKVKSAEAILENLSHNSSAFIYRPILILFHTHFEHDNILNKLEFERSRARSRSQWRFFFSIKH